jgi:hypothetical protein
MLYSRRQHGKADTIYQDRFTWTRRPRLSMTEGGHQAMLMLRPLPRPTPMSSAGPLLGKKPLQHSTAHIGGA